jgi:hypothetical protein
MLGNSGKRCSKYWTFYDSPVLLTLVRSTCARRQGMVEKSVSIVNCGFVVSEEWTFNLTSELTSNFVWSWARQPQRHCSFYMMPMAMKHYLGHDCLNGIGDSCRAQCQWRMTQDQVGLWVPRMKTTWVRIRDMVQEDRTVTVHMLADALKVNKSTCHQILREDLGKRN